MLDECLCLTPSVRGQSTRRPSVSVTVVTVSPDGRRNTMSVKPRSLALLAPCILLCACMTGLIEHMTGEDQANEIRKTGRPARGRVLKMWDTGMSLNDSPI